MMMIIIEPASNTHVKSRLMKFHTKDTQQGSVSVSCHRWMASPLPILTHNIIDIAVHILTLAQGIDTLDQLSTEIVAGRESVDPFKLSPTCRNWPFNSSRVHYFGHNNVAAPILLGMLYCWSHCTHCVWLSGWLTGWGASNLSPCTGSQSTVPQLLSASSFIVIGNFVVVVGCHISISTNVRMTADLMSVWPVGWVGFGLGRMMGGQEIQLAK